MTMDSLGRALALYRRTATSRSALVLLVANGIPLVGVLFFDWSLLTILIVYWIENGIVGFWNLPRIVLAQGSAMPALPPLPDAAAAAATSDAGATPGFVRIVGSTRLPSVGRLALAVFFLVHYGMFWFVHGIFVFALPTFLGAGPVVGTTECVWGPGVFPSGTPGGFPGVDACAAGPFGALDSSSVTIAAAALFLSHGASFLFNYLGAGEYLTASPTAQMGAPYGRVVVLHLTIIFGAFAVAILGSPVGALLILVGLKTAFDLGLHLRQHSTAPESLPPSPSLPPGLAGPA